MAHTQRFGRTFGACLIGMACLCLFAPPAFAAQQPSTKTVVLEAFSQGVHLDTLAAGGLTPAEVATVFDLLGSLTALLDQVTEASESLKAATKRHAAAQRAVHRLGDNDDLIAELSAASSAVGSAQTALSAVRVAFASEFGASLDGALDETRRQRVVNSILNSGYKVPAALLVMPASAADWQLLEQAAATVRTEGIAALTPEQATAWNPVWQRADVQAAEQSREVGSAAIASAFGLYFANLAN